MRKETLAMRLISSVPRGISTARKAPSHLTPISTTTMSQEQHHRTDSECPPHEEKAPRKDDRSGYKNKHGEEIVFRSFNPPPGYVLVPSGNAFITRRCRKQGQKLYALYRPWIRNRLGGLFVPQEVLKNAESDFNAKRKKIERNLSRAIDDMYPKIPSADKKRLHDLILSERSNCTGQSALDHLTMTAFSYVQDKYVRERHTGGRNWNCVVKAHQQVEKILASWRGEDSSGKVKG
jgi:hypothetical protein